MATPIPLASNLPRRVKLAIPGYQEPVDAMVLAVTSTGSAVILQALQALEFDTSNSLPRGHIAAIRAEIARAQKALADAKSKRPPEPAPAKAAAAKPPRVHSSKPNLAPAPMNLDYLKDPHSRPTKRKP